MDLSDDDFKFVGNDLAIDLVNTEMIRTGVRVDLVNTPERFEKWLAASGMPSDESWTVRDHAAALELRAAIREALEAWTGGAPPSERSLERINFHLQQFVETQRLAYRDGAYLLQPQNALPAPKQLLGRLAMAAASLLVSADPKTIKRCASTACILWFKDVSRGLKRRWCSMETCGNRSKVAKHYRASRL